MLRSQSASIPKITMTDISYTSASVSMVLTFLFFFFFFFNDPAPTEIYPFSLPDALPISVVEIGQHLPSRVGVEHVDVTTVVDLDGEGAVPAVPLLVMERRRQAVAKAAVDDRLRGGGHRSGEHTSGIQAQSNILFPLLLVK